MPFNQPFPRSFSANSVREYAPRVSGVYGLSNAKEWIYIGETDDIQAALMGYLQGPEAKLQMRVPTGFVFEVCDSGQRPGRQDRLVSEYEPFCNRRWAPRA